MQMGVCILVGCSLGLLVSDMLGIKVSHYILQITSMYCTLLKHIVDAHARVRARVQGWGKGTLTDSEAAESWTTIA